MNNNEIRCLPASALDPGALTAFVKSHTSVNFHPDWQNLETRLQENSSLVLLNRRDEILALLVAFQDCPSVTWLRKFSYVRPSFDPFSLNRDTFAIPSPQELFALALMQLKKTLVPRTVQQICALQFDSAQWIHASLHELGFEEYDRLIYYQRSCDPLDSIASIGSIEPLRANEIEEVWQLDCHCFSPIWQISQKSLQNSVAHASYATTLKLEGKIYAYQISNEGNSFGHLSRLAVDPTRQRHGLGGSLLADLLRHFAQKGLESLQLNSHASATEAQSFYHSHNFVLEAGSTPVLALSLDEEA